MDLFTTLLILWIVSAPFSYLIVRDAYRLTFNAWSRIDRLCWLSNCVLLGPIILLVMGGVYLLLKIGASAWGQQEASW